MNASLTPLQKFALAEYINETIGRDADFAAFTECLRRVFEDIAGFETIAPSDELVQEIWSLYR
jgi:hypothetical protein